MPEHMTIPDPVPHHPRDTAADLLTCATDAERAARQSAERAEDARRLAAEHDRHAHESATIAKTAQDDARDLLRALANRDETEPPATMTREGGWGDRYTARVTFAHAGMYLTNKTHGGAPRWRAYGMAAYTGTPTDARSVDLYEPVRGTNDPAKLAAQREDAESAVRAFLAQHTAAAWLAERDVEPSDPAPLLTVEPDASIRRGYRDPGMVEVSAAWRVYLTVPGAEPLDLTRDRALTTWAVTDTHTDPWRDEPGAFLLVPEAEWWPLREQRIADPANPYAGLPAASADFHRRHAPDVLAWFLASLRRDRP